MAELKGFILTVSHIHYASQIMSALFMSTNQHALSRDFGTSMCRVTRVLLVAEK